MYLTVNRICRAQEGRTLPELLLASALLAFVLLAGSLAESSLMLSEQDARRSLAATQQLEAGMTAILRDISQAEAQVAEGPPPVTILEPVDGCSVAQIRLEAGAIVQWELDSNQFLVRSLNGDRSGPLFGPFANLCFVLDENGRTVIVEGRIALPSGEIRRLRSAATPWGRN